LERNPLITVERGEQRALPDAQRNPAVLATGPLTSDALAEQVPACSPARDDCHFL